MKRIVLILLTGAVLSLHGCGNTDGYMDSPASSSKGGSMARFTIVGDWLYTVNDSNLRTVSLKDPRRPEPTSDYGEWIGGGIETIFSLGDKLFIGSQNGMYIYSLKLPEAPEHMSASWHTRSCDPVVAANKFAFVTLNSALGTRCGNSSNELLIYNIEDPTAPRLVTSKRMTSPRGLAVDWDARMLFVCDDYMVKAYAIDTDAKDPLEAVFSSTELGRIAAYDCIVAQSAIVVPNADDIEPQASGQGRLLVVAADGFYQLGYDPAGEKKFTLISKLDLK